MLEDWNRIHALEFESTFARVWRDQHANWMCKFTDCNTDLNLKVESLKEAISKSEKMYLDGKYRQPKLKKVRKPAKETSARKKKIEPAELPKKQRHPRKTTKKKKKNVNNPKKSN